MFRQQFGDIGWGRIVHSTAYLQQYLKLKALLHRQPVELLQSWSNGLPSACLLDQSGCKADQLPRRMDSGGWIPNDGFRRVDYGGWFTEDELPRMDSGGWILEDGFRRMDYGGWIPKDGFRRMDFGGWIINKHILVMTKVCIMSESFFRYSLSHIRAYRLPPSVFTHLPFFVTISTTMAIGIDRVNVVSMTVSFSVITIVLSVIIFITIASPAIVTGVGSFIVSFTITVGAPSGCPSFFSWTIPYN